MPEPATTSDGSKAVSVDANTDAIKKALACWSDTSIGSEEEREVHDRAVAAVAALERERDTAVREAREARGTLKQIVELLNFDGPDGRLIDRHTGFKWVDRIARSIIGGFAAGSGEDAAGGETA